MKTCNTPLDTQKSLFFSMGISRNKKNKRKLHKLKGNEWKWKIDSEIWWLNTSTTDVRARLNTYTHTLSNIKYVHEPDSQWKLENATSSKKVHINTYQNAKSRFFRQHQLIVGWNGKKRNFCSCWEVGKFVLEKKVDAARAKIPTGEWEMLINRWMRKLWWIRIFFSFCVPFKVCSNSWFHHMLFHYDEKISKSVNFNRHKEKEIRSDCHFFNL